MSLYAHILEGILNSEVYPVEVAMALKERYVKNSLML